MIKLYTFSSCTSCRKAREMLMANQVPFKEHNMNTDPLTDKEILQLLSYTTNGTTDIMSKRSQDVKDLNIDLDDLALHEWIELVNQHPGILRRPLLLTPEQLIIGYNKEEYQGVIRKTHNKKRSFMREVACS